MMFLMMLMSIHHHGDDENGDDGDVLDGDVCGGDNGDCEDL